MHTLQDVKDELRFAGTPERAKVSAWFFKTGPGQYAEGDVFLGVTVPEQRKIAKRYVNLPLSDIVELLHSVEHEYRLCALILLVGRFARGSESERRTIYELYLQNTKWVNNWDLVDASAEYIVGAYLLDKDHEPLVTLANSALLWDRRIAIVATFAFIKQGESDATIEIARILLQDPHDLIQKAVGWMLREVGKRASLEAQTEFLDEYAAVMPRTMLRYAIERFPFETRLEYLTKRTR